LEFLKGGVKEEIYLEQILSVHVEETLYDVTISKRFWKR
jgi:hypothetical protein